MKKRLKITVKLTLISIVFIVGLGLLLYGLLSKDYIDIRYVENNKVNYKVYLKENNYFESDYLGENRTYIASLIDYIDIDYNYVITYDKLVSGNYRYYIKATILANKPEGEGYYWRKDFQLTEPKKVNIKDLQSYAVVENIKVNYDEYNQILNGFKKEYSMQTDGELIISLVVESTTTGEEYTEEIKVDSDLSLSIPLLEQTVDASIQKDAISKEKTLSMIDNSKKIFYYVCSLIGVVIIVISVIEFIKTIIYSIMKSKKNLYRTKLNKILHNHDSIIANVNTLPDLKELNVIDVQTFEELIDVYNEVRMPINYYQDNRRYISTFMIINDGIAWVYKFNKEDIEDDNKESNSKVR